MQVILSESEYNNLVKRSQLYSDTMEKISSCFNVEYDFEHDTIQKVSINLNNVIDLASSGARREVIEKGVYIVNNGVLVQDIKLNNT